MKIKLISCNVFTREASAAISASDLIIDPEYLPLGAHENPVTLGKEIQNRIDDASEGGYDRILLLYGLCGNALDGITARSLPVTLIRAHDCCTIFLGGRERFKEHFGSQLSGEWTNRGYAERSGDYLRDTDTGKSLGLDKDYNQMVEQYGRENADYIWQTLHPDTSDQPLTFIASPLGGDSDLLTDFRRYAEENGRELRLLDGDNSLIEKLISGRWDSADFLTLKPGEVLAPVWDLDNIFSASLPENGRDEEKS